MSPGWLLATMLIAPLAAFPTLAVADVFQLSSDESNALFDRAKVSIVQVHSGNPGFISAGTGFFIDNQGTVLTSSSIIGDNSSARVVINGVEMDAKIIGNDPRSGLAMLHVSYGASPAPGPGARERPAVGRRRHDDRVSVEPAGRALHGPVSGFDASFLSHVDSALSPKSSVAAVERFATTHIHANVAISPGQVGGPLLNSRGEVVGLVATSPDDGRSVYALPVEAINKIMADFNQYGRAKYGWVGVNVREVPDASKDGRTVRVVEAVAGTPASESGILPGDTVMRIDAAKSIARPMCSTPRSSARSART